MKKVAFAFRKIREKTWNSFLIRISAYIIIEVNRNHLLFILIGIIYFSVEIQLSTNTTKYEFNSSIQKKNPKFPCKLRHSLQKKHERIATSNNWTQSIQTQMFSKLAATSYLAQPCQTEHTAELSKSNKKKIIYIHTSNALRTRSSSVLYAEVFAVRDKKSRKFLVDFCFDLAIWK